MTATDSANNLEELADDLTLLTVLLCEPRQSLHVAS